MVSAQSYKLSLRRIYHWPTACGPHWLLPWYSRHNWNRPKSTPS